MVEVFFQVRLTVEPKSDGDAALVPPDGLAGIDFSYVAVKDGGEEAIIRLSPTPGVMQALERRKEFTRLAPKRREQLRASYSAPRIKKQLRMRSNTSDLKPGGNPPKERFELDYHGNQIVDTFQTVRSGFYLIDVPIIGEESGAAPASTGPGKTRSRRGKA
jgi:hypothetical protein